MTILVTGAAGLLGGHVADLALERGEAVRVLARPGEDVAWLAKAGAEVCRGDLADRPSLEVAVNGVDRIVHCAARTGPWGRQAEYEITNVYGVKTLVDAALTAGVRRIVHVSSISVHGIDIHGTADELAPLCGGYDLYSKSKVAGEHLLQQMIRDKGAPVVIVRPGLIYGPRDTNSFGRFAMLIEQGKLPIIGSGNNHLPLIYVTDVAWGILLASEVDQIIGRAYLLVNDEPVTQRDYFNTMAEELGARPPRWRVPYRVALGLGAMAEVVGHVRQSAQPPPLMRFGVEQMAGENRFIIHRARCELGFSPQINLAEGVRRGIAWYRATQHRQSIEGA